MDPKASVLPTTPQRPTNDQEGPVTATTSGKSEWQQPTANDDLKTAADDSDWQHACSYS